MVLFLLFIFGFYSAIDSASVRPGPYQNLDYELTDLGFQTSFDPSSGDIYLFHNQDRTLITISEMGKVDTVDTISQRHEALNKMDLTHSGESVYFWENSIGRVHRYDLSAGEMEREDTSHSHRTMHRHSAFLSKDNYIYAIGGYGYWEMRNFLIRYEPKFGQWEKVPSINDEIVIRSRSGLLYKIENSFFYFVDSSESNDLKHTHTYSFDMDTGMWKKEHQLENVFENFSIMNRFGSRKFAQNTTYMVDEDNRHLGFLSTIGRNDNLNIVSIDESTIYQLNLSAIGIHDVRAAFYSDRIGKWVILGHEFPIAERKKLKAHLFEFDKNHRFITAHGPETALAGEAVLLTAGGALAAGLFGFFLYFLLRVKSSNGDYMDHGTVSPAKKTVEIFKDDSGSISVFINGKRFKTSEDKAMNEFWAIIAEQVESREASILISDIDQRIYSSQSHPSYNSRNRKKLVKIINTACGFDLISEERSKIDKRYKVLTVKIDKIDLKDR